MKIKTLILLTSLLCFAFVSKLEAQVAMSTIDGVYQVVPDMPVPPGGSMESFIQYFQENMKYPDLAKKKGIEGMVAVSFIVLEDGKVSDVSILRGIGGGCDEEAYRLVKESGTWTPGKLEGKAVPVQMRLPIQFKL